MIPKGRPGFPAPPTPACSFSQASTSTMPLSANGLPPVSGGLKLLGVYIGHGTQNYTCSANSATVAPASIGAVASLYDATCEAIASPPSAAFTNGPANALKTASFSQPAGTTAIAGIHYFADTTTPTFAMLNLGFTYAKKLANVTAPAGSSPGVKTGQTNGAVPWLKLEHETTGEVGHMQEIYRLNTAGGMQPKTCAGQPAAFQIEYAAEYWMWG
ncbi:hypothetical protein MMC25_002795 [Agyrium rufum]|nr:hypothetical protein [Agyrium rufum]